MYAYYSSTSSLQPIIGGGVTSGTKMSPRVLKQALPNKCFTQQEFNILLRPVFGWEGLQKHHDFLFSFSTGLRIIGQYTYLEIHLHQLVRPFDKKGCTHIEVKS